MKFIYTILIILLICKISTADNGKGFVTLHVQSKKIMASTPLPFMNGKQFADTNRTNSAGGSIFPVAIYWTNLLIGTPPIKVPAAIDSGSFTLNIPDANCQGCVQNLPPNIGYRSSKSSTSHLLKCSDNECPFDAGCSWDKNICQFSNSYQTCDLKDPEAVCTITGDWYMDEVAFVGLNSVNVTVGSITKQTANFDQFKHINAVVGMAGEQTIFQNMYNEGVVKRNIWAMCINQGSAGNGSITLGGIDERLYNGKIVYTPNTSPQMYAMSVQSFGISNNSRQYYSTTIQQDAILDSGTNVLLTPSGIFEQIKNMFLNYCSNDHTLVGLCTGLKVNGTGLFDKQCFALSPAQMAAFPDFTTSIGKDLVLTLKPKDYLIIENQPGKYCLGIRDTGDFGLFIIGNTHQENYYNIFDREQNRIGWAPVNRRNCGNIGSL